MGSTLQNPAGFGILSSRHPFFWVEKRPSETWKASFRHLEQSCTALDTWLKLHRFFGRFHGWKINCISWLGCIFIYTLVFTLSILSKVTKDIQISALLVVLFIFIGLKIYSWIGICFSQNYSLLLFFRTLFLWLDNSLFFYVCSRIFLMFCLPSLKLT